MRQQPRTSSVKRQSCDWTNSLIEHRLMTFQQTDSEGCELREATSGHLWGCQGFRWIWTRARGGAL